mmetsp:Transcript_11730/g.22318  ORF Transcript_11730/g.22318 Transcript_11730/m.22318 type:complete len:241 (+) Transcript_11730:4627-5349(+)
MLTPSQGGRHEGSLRQLSLHGAVLIRKSVAVHAAVQVTADKTLPVRSSSAGHNVAVCVEQQSGLVVPQNADTQFAVSQTEHDLVAAAMRPAKASHWRRLGELVADSFLVSPVGSELVYEDDVVALSNSEFGAVRGEGQRANKVVTGSFLVARFCREFLNLFALVVVEDNVPVDGGYSQAQIVRGPRQSCDLLKSPIDHLGRVVDSFQVTELHIHCTLSTRFLEKKEAGVGRDLTLSNSIK